MLYLVLIRAEDFACGVPGYLHADVTMEDPETVLCLLQSSFSMEHSCSCGRARGINGSINQGKAQALSSNPMSEHARSVLFATLQSARRAF